MLDVNLVSYAKNAEQNIKWNRVEVHLRTYFCKESFPQIQRTVEKVMTTFSEVLNVPRLFVI